MHELKHNFYSKHHNLDKIEAISDLILKILSVQFIVFWNLGISSRVIFDLRMN